MAEYVCKTRDFINGEAKVYTVVCDDCKVLSREQQSASKRGEKNPNWTGGHKKIPMSKEQFSARASARMKVDNPMYNPKVAARVHNTIQQKRRTGEIRTLTGPQHWLWRGSRKPSFTLRTRIKPWSREILRRDDFTCQLCGVRGGRLEAHHLVPFKDIVATALQELGLSNLVGMSTESSDFARLADLVVAKHNLGMGVTYCTACHGHTDAARRVKGKKCK